jgi:pimeloyl-ACP methyl ester carboxylesterase
MVLLHAFPLHARMWEPQLALAEHGWRIIAPDLRGFGDGASDAPAFSMDDYAGGVIDLLDSLKVEDAVIGGLSMGGYVAFTIVRHAPRYVRALVLADTRSQADAPEGLEARRRMLQVLADRGPSAIADDMVPRLLGASTRANRPDLVEQIRTMILSNPAGAIDGAIRALMTRRDSTPLLSSIHCPTLILVGTEDTLTPPAMSEQMQRGIAGSQLVTIPGAGHLTNLEATEAFNTAVGGFLSKRA